MSCSSCGSDNQRKFESEISIHFAELKDKDKRPILVFQELAVCLNCGKGEFFVPESKLMLLAKRDAARGG
jgi:hypothetical protein